MAGAETTRAIESLWDEYELAAKGLRDVYVWRSGLDRDKDLAKGAILHAVGIEPGEELTEEQKQWGARATWIAPYQPYLDGPMSQVEARERYARHVQARLTDERYAQEY